MLTIFISFFIKIVLCQKENIFFSSNTPESRILQTTYQIESSISQIYGNSSQLNYYYINLYLGEKKEKQSLILDTGSQLTAIPCKPLCDKCGKHLNSYYTLKNNTQILSCNDNRCSQLKHDTCSSSNDQCSFNISYGEGSYLKGVFFEDLISFGDGYNQKGQPYKIPVGCVTEESKQFTTQSVDGIMGLSNTDTSIVSFLHKEKMIPHNIFSLCFSRDKGYFTLGEINSTFHIENISYVPFKQSDKYKIGMKELIVNNQKVTINYDAVLDSGTTLSYFPKQLNEEISKMIVKNCQNPLFCNDNYINPSLGLCFKLKDNKLKQDLLSVMPNLTFSLNDKVNYTLMAEDYYFEIMQNSKLEICVGFLSWNNNEILLGGNFMHNHDIIFNKESKKIGFARSLCSNESLEKNISNLKIDCASNNTLLENIKEYLSLLMFILLFIAISLGTAIYFLQRGREFLCYKFKYGNINGTFQGKVGSMDEIKLDKEENKEENKPSLPGKDDFEVSIDIGKNSK